jgi:acetyl esterase/lipase
MRREEITRALMKKSLLIVQCAWLLLIVGCAAPASAPTAVSETTVPRPTATSIPQPEPFPTAVKPDWLNVPYVPEGSSLQRLDVYLPANGDGPFPTILAIHGGGFRALSKTLYSRLAGHLNELGYAVVSTDYRLTPGYSYPAQVEDVFCALAWIHANHATHGFDNERIIVMGDSSGGYLAAMLGTVNTPSLYLENCPYSLPASDWIQGVVIFYGFYDFMSIDGYRREEVVGYLQPFWGAEYSEIPPETLAEMSPMSWVDGSEPPFLLIHGTSDTSIPSWMSEKFAAELDDTGVDVELLLVDAEHAFILKPLSNPENVQSLAAIEAFLSARSEQ